ncbi:MAG: hypothetical protein AAF725_26060 [Acidobacteriota bacterium]
MSETAQTRRLPPAAALRGAAIVALAALCGGVLWASRQSAESLEDRQRRLQRTETVLSEVYRVDRIYRSMMGPWSGQKIALGNPETDRVVWITGYRAVMVGADGESAMPQQFMCHSNLDVDREAHFAAMGESPGFGSRLFTLSQGQLEIDFPPGFGIPVRAGEALDLTTQVLNLNLPSPDPSLEVRHRVSLDYVIDREIGPGMVPLLPTAAYGLALIEGEDGYFGIDEPRAERHGPGCLVGETASDHSYEDGLGRTFSGHWQVPPGRQENRTLVTQLMRVPYETTIHYIAVHLHPFAESLTLRDLTAGKDLFVSRARNFEAGEIGLRQVDAFSSQEGIAVFPDHEYELVSVYDNTTPETQDSMAVMYLYLKDQVLQGRLEGAGRAG